MDTNRENQSSYLDFEEAANFLNVKQSWLRGVVFKREIPFYKFRRLIRFHISDLLIWANKSRVPDQSED